MRRALSRFMVLSPFNQCIMERLTSKGSCLRKSNGMGHLEQRFDLLDHRFIQHPQREGEVKQRLGGEGDAVDPLDKRRKEVC